MRCWLFEVLSFVLLMRCHFDFFRIFGVFFFWCASVSETTRRRFWGYEVVMCCHIHGTWHSAAAVAAASDRLVSAI